MVAYTIRSARYANEQQTAAVINTVEDADVLVSLEDTPELWAQMLASGVTIEPLRLMPHDIAPATAGRAPIVIA